MLCWLVSGMLVIFCVSTAHPWLVSGMVFFFCLYTAHPWNERMGELWVRRCVCFCFCSCVCVCVCMCVCVFVWGWGGCVFISACMMRMYMVVWVCLLYSHTTHYFCSTVVFIFSVSNREVHSGEWWTSNGNGTAGSGLASPAWSVCLSICQTLYVHYLCGCSLSYLS